MTRRPLRIAHVNVAELRLPADTAYVAVLRMTTTGLAGRLDFTLDDIEDLRMAVGEACALLLEHADADSADPGELCCRFELGGSVIRVQVSVTGTDGSGPDVDSFGWQVLNALASDVHADHDDGRCTITFSVASGTA